LEDAVDRKVQSFSGGMKRRLGLALILLDPPPLIIIDEPTAGLDPESRVHFRNILTELSKKSTIILSTHIVEDVEKTCDHLAIMNKGRIIFLGKAQDLKKRTEGSIWEITITESELRDIRRKYKILDKRRVPEGIQCRIIASQKPFPQARELQPKLEDAYIYHLSQAQKEEDSINCPMERSHE